MLNKNRRIIATAIAAVLMAGSLVACAKPDGKPADKTAAADAPKEQPKKSYNFKMLGMRITPNKDSEVMKKFNEKLGGNTLEVTNVPDADYLAKIQLLLAAQDLPDIFLTWSSQTVLEKATAKFTEEEFKQYMPDVYNLALKNFANNGYSKDSMFSRMKVNGKFAGFGAGSQVSLTPYGMIVRTDVLEQLGKTMPKTIADWDDVFKAYKLKYPDKYPVAARGKDWILGSFRWVLGAYGTSVEGWHMKDGKLMYGPFMPEMRNALAQLQKWYKDGYINPEWVTMDSPGYSNDFYNGNSIFMQVQSPLANVLKPPYIPGSAPDLAAAKIPNIKMDWGPYPALKQGDKPIYIAGDLLNGMYFVAFGSQLEKDRDKLHAAMDVINRSMSKDMYTLRSYGVEGKTFDYVDGVPVVKKELNNDDAKVREGFGWLGAIAQVGADWDYTKQLTSKPVKEQLATLIDDPNGHYGKNNLTVTVTAPPGPITSPSGEDLTIKGKALFDQWLSLYTQVIIGKKTLEDYDAFIDQWKKQVGNDLTEAVNRLYLKDWKK